MFFAMDYALVTYVEFYDPLFPIQVLCYSPAFSNVLTIKGLQSRFNNMLPHMVHPL